MPYTDKTPEEIASYNAKRAVEIKAYSRKMYYIHREKRLAKAKLNRSKTKDFTYAVILKNYYANKNKWFARMKAQDLPIGSQCESCGGINNLERHHPDYSKPLEIKTLCRDCHKKLHRKCHDVD